MLKHILILEDAQTRRKAFSLVAKRLSVSCMFWDSAKQMTHDLSGYLAPAVLISMDYDLVPESTSPDQGSGMDVCMFLATMRPICPVILHTANESAGRRMADALTNANWQTEHLRHDSASELWIGQAWLPLVAHLLSSRHD